MVARHTGCLCLQSGDSDALYDRHDTCGLYETFWSIRVATQFFLEWGAQLETDKVHGQKAWGYDWTAQHKQESNALTPRVGQLSFALRRWLGPSLLALTICWHPDPSKK